MAGYFKTIGTGFTNTCQKHIFLNLYQYYYIVTQGENTKPKFCELMKAPKHNLLIRLVESYYSSQIFLRE